MFTVADLFEGQLCHSFDAITHKKYIYEEAIYGQTNHCLDTIVSHILHIVISILILSN